MNLKAKWRLLITPFLIIVGFYLFLIGANYYYARDGRHTFCSGFKP